MLTNVNGDVTNRPHRWVTPLRVAVGIGLLLCVSTLLVHLYLATYPYFAGFPPTLGWQLWFFGGAFLFGAIPAYVSARYRLVSPATLTVGAYGYALAVSWTSLVESAQSPGAGITPYPFDFLLWFWPGLLAVALVVGGLEYGGRRVLSGS